MIFRNKKNKIVLAIIIVILCIISSILLLGKKDNNELNYCQEYIAGRTNIKGNVDVKRFENISRDFEIGANKLGYAVFKTPDKAMLTLKRNYSVGIKVIKDEFKLNDLNNQTVEEYKEYGTQITKGTKEEKKQAAFVSEFLDIYENSIDK